MPIGEGHGRPPDPQTQGSTIREPESDDPKARVRAHQARMPVLDEGARTRPDPAWASSSSIRTPVHGQQHRSRGRKTFTYHVWGASCMLPHLPLKNPPSSFSPFPSPLDTLVRNLSCGEGAATERRATEDCRPEPSKPLKSQPESLQEVGVVPLVPGDSPALPDDIDPHPFGLAAWSWTRMREKLNARAVTRTNEGERCQSWALHQPWPRVPPASNSLARLKEPSPLRPRHWCPGRKTWPRAKSRSCRRRQAKPTSHHLRRCRRRVSATQRRCHESASSSVTRTG